MGSTRLVGRLRRATARRAGGERGAASLFEVLTTLALLSIVMVVVYEGIVSMGSALEGGTERLVNLDEGRTLMAVATKDVRTATRLSAGTSPFVLAEKREITFYGNLNPIVGTAGPRKIHMYVDSSTQLIEEVQAPDAGSAPNYTYNGPKTIRFVGRYVANPVNRPIFRYYDENRNELTNVPLSAADSLAVHSVRIELAIKRSQAYNVNYTTLVNQVRLPNVDYAAAQGG